MFCFYIFSCIATYRLMAFAASFFAAREAGPIVKINNVECSFCCYNGVASVHWCVGKCCNVVGCGFQCFPLEWKVVCGAVVLFVGKFGYTVVGGGSSSERSGCCLRHRTSLNRPLRVLVPQCLLLPRLLKAVFACCSCFLLAQYIMSFPTVQPRRHVFNQ